MKNEKNIILKGKAYDSITGMPLKSHTSKHKIAPIKKTIVTSTARSIAHKTALHSKPLMRKIGHSMDIARSKSITKFASHNKPNMSVAGNNFNNHQKDIKPVRHPLTKKVDHIIEASKKRVVNSEIIRPAKQIKEEAIAEAINKIKDSQPKKVGFLKRNSKFINIFSVSSVLIIIIGYLTYLNIPDLSVRIASAQAGINATCPSYRPDGYSINGPITYSDGEVLINFKSNTGTSNFVIKQTRSSWDSSAVRNMVDKESNSEFVTTEERGLTIFTYNGNAAWVNGGILYTIKGNAPLSSDQVRRIATSL